MYYMGIDIGTTSTKIIMCDNNGKIIYSIAKEQDLYSDYPGWTEVDPSQWQLNTQKMIRFFYETDILPEDIKAIGVTGMVPEDLGYLSFTERCT